MEIEKEKINEVWIEDKRVMIELLKNKEIVEKKKKVEREKCGKKVGDEKSGEKKNKKLNGVMDKKLRLRIEDRCGIVKNEDRRIREEGEGNWKEMKIKEGKIKEEIEKKSKVEIGKKDDKVMRDGKERGLIDIGMWWEGEGIGDVLRKSKVKKDWLMMKDGDMRKKGRMCEIGDVLKVDKDWEEIEVIKKLDEIKEGSIEGEGMKERKKR